MKSRDGKLSWYEVSIGAAACAVAIGAGLVVAPRLVGGGVGLSLLTMLLIMFCVLPAWHEVNRETSKGRGWKALKDPHRSRFRALVIRHLAFLWTYAAAGLSVVALLFVQRLELGAALAVLAGLTLALFLVSIIIRRSLRKVWAQVETDPKRLWND